MRKYILIAARAIFSVLLCSAAVFGGQYIKIEKIDAESAYPAVNLFISALTPSKSLLQKDTISLYEDGNEVAGDFTLTPQPDVEDYSYLVISIDSSKSIRKKFLGFSKASAKELAKRRGPKTKTAVYRFNDSVVLLTDFSLDTDTIAGQINSIERHGKRTLLYDALHDAIRLLDKIKQGDKRIIAYTDGKDEGSCATEEDIARAARDAGIPIYFICPRRTGYTKLLKRISNLTGGVVAYHADSARIAAIFSAAPAMSKHNYLVRYRSNLKADGRLHTIEVRLKRGATKDSDSAVIRAAKSGADRCPLPSENTLLIGIIALLCIILFAMIIFLLRREKKFFEEIFKIERKLTAEKPGQGAADMQAPGLLQSRIDPESLYRNAWLFQKNGPDAGKKFPVYLREVTIGRSRSSHIVINDDAVSDYHAKIKNRGGAYQLYDLLSEQGVFLNGKKLLRPKQLHDWDEIKLGSTFLIFRGS